MQKHSLMKGIVGISFALFATANFAMTPEGFWKSIDDRTGEQLSIVEIKKKPDNTYTGTIVYRYPVPGGGSVLTNCVKCPELMCAELAGDFHLGDSRQLTDKSLLPFDLVS